MKTSRLRARICRLALALPVAVFRGWLPGLLSHRLRGVRGCAGSPAGGHGGSGSAELQSHCNPSLNLPAWALYARKLSYACSTFIRRCTPVRWHSPMQGSTVVKSAALRAHLTDRRLGCSDGTPCTSGTSAAVLCHSGVYAIFSASGHLRIECNNQAQLHSAHN